MAAGPAQVQGSSVVGAHEQLGRRLAQQAQHGARRDRRPVLDPCRWPARRASVCLVDRFTAGAGSAAASGPGRGVGPRRRQNGPFRGTRSSACSAGCRRGVRVTCVLRRASMPPAPGCARRWSRRGRRQAAVQSVEVGVDHHEVGGRPPHPAGPLARNDSTSSMNVVRLGAHGGRLVSRAPRRGLPPRGVSTTCSYVVDHDPPAQVERAVEQWGFLGRPARMRVDDGAVLLDATSHAAAHVSGRRVAAKEHLPPGADHGLQPVPRSRREPSPPAPSRWPRWRPGTRLVRPRPVR